MADEDLYYIGIRQPVLLRKSILESSKGVLISLQDYEVIKNMKKEKINLQKQIIKDIHDLRSLISKLDRQLPSIDLKDAVQKQPTKTNFKKKELKDFEEELKKMESSMGL